MAEPLTFKATMEFEYGVPRTMSPGVVRLVANNPSPYTFKGTNTYLIGTKSRRFKIADLDAWIEAHK